MKPFLQQFEGIEDVSHATSMLLDILVQVWMFLQLGILAERNQNISLFSNGLIPKLSHILPKRSHTTRSINQANNNFIFDSLCHLDRERRHLENPVRVIELFLFWLHLQYLLPYYNEIFFS